MSNFIEFIEGEEGVDIGDVRAIDYAEAVDWGLEPESYKKDIPIGYHTVKLIFKTWGKKNSLNCFFQTIPNKKRYKITFFNNKYNQYRYSARDNLIDFSEPNIIGNTYELKISRTGTNNLRVDKAILIESLYN